MSPWWQRIVTVLAGVGLGTLGTLVPATAAFALPAAGMLLGWAVPHPADHKKPAP